MEGSEKNDGNGERRSPFDNLDRDELIKKCKGLLGIAQKAKKAKDDYANEVTSLKEKLTEYETQKNADKESLKTMQLLVDTLTQNKLDASTQIADFQRTTKEATKQLQAVNEKCSQLEIECEAQKRQIKRLTDENVEQENDLMNLNDRFSKVSELSHKQTQELLTLEKSVEQWKKIEIEFENLKTENRLLQQKWDENESNLNDVAVCEIASPISDEEKLKHEETEKELEIIKNDLTTALNEIASLKELSLSQSEEKLDEIKLLKCEHEKMQKENDEQQEKLTKYKTKIIEFSSKLKQLKQCRDILKVTVTQYSTAIGQWQCEIGEASKQLIQHIEILRIERDKLSTELNGRSNELEQLKNLQIALTEKSTAIKLLEQQNDELLTEMRELNDVLKNRGNVISNQTSEIDELKKKQQEQCQRIAQLDELLNEKGKLLDQMRSINDSQSDIMSTSTISRADEVARMHDIEDSFEEKYNKLRGLAVKLKKKVAEQQAIIKNFETTQTQSGSVHASASANEPSGIKIQNLKTLQTENDRLMDQIDAMKEEKRKIVAEMKALNEKLQKYEEEVKSMQIVKDQEKKSCNALEESVKAKEKEYQAIVKEVQGLKEQISKLEAELKKSKAEIHQKEEEIASKSETITNLKSELCKLKASLKKNNVLNLEMEAYEKSSKEMAQKLETKVMQLAEMEAATMSKESTIKSLRNEIRTLNETFDTEKQSSSELQHEIEMLRIKLKDASNELSDAKQIANNNAHELSLVKLELASLQTEQSQADAERQKQLEKFKTENEQSIGQLFALQEQVRDLQTKLNNSELELVNVQTEFASYKVRAQYVLRQNKSKDSSAEEELKEEIDQLTKANDDFKSKLLSITEQNRQMKDSIDDLQKDKQNLHERCKKLIELLDEVKEQVDQLQNDNRQLEQEHQETLKKYRLQIDTLNSCYKKQIDELKENHQLELNQLKHLKVDSAANANIEKTKDNNTAAVLTNEQRIELIMTERQSGEGSENVGSIPNRKSSTVKNRHNVIPLDELLSRSFEENDDIDVTEREDVNVIKEKLTVQQRRVNHISALLSEAECDVARLTQMNDVLKEELRRQERSVEREKHMHNLEYMKNVIFKFLTINSTDEREHLVPVLNTILKLSSEECKQLQAIAKGVDSNQSAWSNLLPMW